MKMQRVILRFQIRVITNFKKSRNPRDFYLPKINELLRVISIIASILSLSDVR